MVIQHSRVEVFESRETVALSIAFQERQEQLQPLLLRLVLGLAKAIFLHGFGASSQTIWRRRLPVLHTATHAPAPCLWHVLMPPHTHIHSDPTDPTEIYPCSFHRLRFFPWTKPYTTPRAAASSPESCTTWFRRRPPDWINRTAEKCARRSSEAFDLGGGEDRPVIYWSLKLIGHKESVCLHPVGFVHVLSSSFCSVPTRLRSSGGSSG